MLRLMLQFSSSVSPLDLTSGTFFFLAPPHWPSLGLALWVCLGLSWETAHTPITSLLSIDFSTSESAPQSSLYARFTPFWASLYELVKKPPDDLMAQHNKHDWMHNWVFPLLWTSWAGISFTASRPQLGWLWQLGASLPRTSHPPVG